MSGRLRRLAPLTGVLFAVLVVVGVFTSSSETPEANSSSAKVIAYYGTHGSEVETSAILFALAFLVIVLFAGVLRSYLRRTPAVEAGALISSGVEYGLAHNLSHLSPATAQTMNLLSQELFLPIIGGAFLFAICSGLAILRGAALPKWLGWVAIVLGIAALIPPASFPALIGFVIWSIIVSILMYLRTDAVAPAPSTDAPSMVGASG